MQQSSLIGESEDSSRIYHGKATPRQLRAIGNYLQKGYRPMLSTHPTYYFQSKVDGSQVSHHIDDLVAWYDQDRREAARQRRAEKAQ